MGKVSRFAILTFTQRKSRNLSINFHSKFYLIFLGKTQFFDDLKQAGSFISEISYRHIQSHGLWLKRA
jgi:hypothetical protein